MRQARSAGLPEMRVRRELERLPARRHGPHAPKPHVWIIGRTKTDGPADCEAVTGRDGLARSKALRPSLIAARRSLFRAVWLPVLLSRESSR